MREPVVVDCANGVGGLKMARLLEECKKSKCPFSAELRNVDNTEKLNDRVGAEHVQKMQMYPHETVDLETDFGRRFASFDGDADRLVYFYPDRKDPAKMRLLDGDKIAALFALFIRKQG